MKEATWKLTSNHPTGIKTVGDSIHLLYESFQLRQQQAALFSACKDLEGHLVELAQRSSQRSPALEPPLLVS